MLKNIVKGYGQLLSSVGKVLVLLLLCAGIGAAFVFPLWKFATDLPKVYTFTVLFIAALLFILFVVKKARSSGLKNSLNFIAKFFIIVAGIFGIVALVMRGHRFFAIPVLVLMILAYGFFSFGIKENKAEKIEAVPAEDDSEAL